jgi:2-polyprenyl-3-methyl-5-hydroxy-6-metoxy-1,4-benzoquinol methylase
VILLPHPDGTVRVTELGARRRIELEPGRSGVYVDRASIETTYPIALIQQVLEVCGFGWLCDAIARDEDPDLSLQRELALFVPADGLRGKRVLDFGCGAGGSTCVLGRLLPETEIVGVELNDRLLKLAAARAEHHGLSGVQFLASPAPNRLPTGIGSFDLVILSAVYEHLLPDEREVLLRALWSVLRPGGVLFLNQTPHRWFPIELHSTQLPLLNYLPLPIAARAAGRWSRQKGASWSTHDVTTHLRGGLRGATEREVLRFIGAPADILPPCRPGLGDRVDAWFSLLSPRHRAAKQLARLCLKAVYRLTGTVFTPNLTLAIRKPR